MNKIFGAIGGLTLAAICVAPALAETYTCAFKPKKSNVDWIPKQVVIQKSAAGYMVNDPVIKYFIGQPIPAEIEVDNAKRTTFKWLVKSTKSSTNQHANFSFRMTKMKGSSQARIQAIPNGYANRFEGVGSCNVK